MQHMFLSFVITKLLSISPPILFFMNVPST
ncbi:hypothetical protein MTR67_027314 [Solanum verrucosum]|uniref:Uncharacterized protein n=1 Tax=Solanum verrucosum TaxID=315347 RepID=A0AAF0R0H4_SOLVR|nr:hypothetical protein MTR67_027314 [Solanum verrucosum]